MSALMHIGEADHHILNADAEVVGVACHGVGASLARVREQLTEAHAALGACRLALRSHLLTEVLEYHEVMAVQLRDAAKAARMPPGCSMYLQAGAHKQRAAALRRVIGYPSDDLPDKPLT